MMPLHTDVQPLLRNRPDVLTTRHQRPHLNTLPRLISFAVMLQYNGITVKRLFVQNATVVGRLPRHVF